MTNVWRKIQAGDTISTGETIRIYATQAWIDSYSESSGTSSYQLSDNSGTQIRCTDVDENLGLTQMFIYKLTSPFQGNYISLFMDDGVTEWIGTSSVILPATLGDYVETNSPAFDVTFTSVSGDIADMIYVYREPSTAYNLYYNGTQLEHIYFNGTEVTSLYFNGTQII